MWERWDKREAPQQIRDQMNRRAHLFLMCFVGFLPIFLANLSGFVFIIAYPYSNIIVAVLIMCIMGIEPFVLLLLTGTIQVIMMCIVLVETLYPAKELLDWHFLCGQYLLYLCMYIPSLIVISRPALFQHACYKIMFMIGLWACQPVQGTRPCLSSSSSYYEDEYEQLKNEDNVLGFVFTFLGGVFSFMGANYCDHNQLLNIVGHIAHVIWTVYCAMIVVLALNRCIEIHSQICSTALLWQSGLALDDSYILYGAAFSTSTDLPVIYNSVYSVFFFQIDFRDGAPTVHNWLCFVNSCFVITFLTVLYSLLLVRLRQRTKIISQKSVDGISGVQKNTKGEIITDGLIKHCLLANKNVFIPRFKKGARDMEMLRLNSLDEYNQLESTLWGIRQHPLDLVTDSLEQMENGQLDVIVMPGVAFSSSGHRLGHGKGFYDRFLHNYETKYGVHSSIYYTGKLGCSINKSGTTSLTTVMSELAERVFNKKYLKQEHLRGFDNYKYCCIDNSPIAVYISHPFWNWFVNFYPKWLAPNVLTLAGASLVMGCYFLVAFLDHDLTANSPDSPPEKNLPDWLWLLCAVCTFAGHLLDGTDGKQARRVGASGPTGELFDHGLDSWATVPFTVTFFSIWGLGIYSISPVRLLVNTGFPSCTCWPTFSDTGHTNSTFSEMSILLMFLNLDFIFVWSCRKQKSFYEFLVPMMSPSVLFTVSVVWAIYSPSKVIDQDPRTFLWTMGVVFANIAVHLIISQMSSTRAQVFNKQLFVYCAAAVLSLLGVFGWAELLMVRLLGVGLTLWHVHYGVCVVRQLKRVDQSK
uniref:Uncharacterized protein n=1 Tax=Ditylenchus dipsaci TaxID=166011 RepID=A0A915EBT0_9BILA